MGSFLYCQPASGEEAGRVGQNTFARTTMSTTCLTGLVSRQQQTVGLLCFHPSHFWLRPREVEAGKEEEISQKKEKVAILFLFMNPLC